MTELTIRRMATGELEIVAGLWWQSLVDATPWLRPEQRHSEKKALRWFRKVAAATGEIWVAEHDGVVVGMLAMSPGVVDQLYVATGRQGCGFGGALLAHAKSLYPDGLRLVTLQRNERARGFYEHHGFESFAEGTSPPPEEEPDIWYRWPPAE